jgi:hypothetical protein
MAQAASGRARATKGLISGGGGLCEFRWALAAVLRYDVPWAQCGARSSGWWRPCAGPAGGSKTALRCGGGGRGGVEVRPPRGSLFLCQQRALSLKNLRCATMASGDQDISDSDSALDSLNSSHAANTKTTAERNKVIHDEARTRRIHSSTTRTPTKETINDASSRWGK